EATVHVRMRAPRIVSQPVGVSVDEGDPARFEVVAEGSALAYQWQRDGADIAGATGASFEIASVGWSDRGARFTVTVTNAGGSVGSAAAILTVRQRPPVIVAHPADQAVREGDRARFSVVAAGSELGYEWRVGGVVLAGETASTL